MMRGLAPALAAAAIALPAGAQPRTVEVARQLADSGEHRVRVQYTGGRLALAPGPAALMFEMELEYDEQFGDPLHSYDPDARSLTLGMSRRRSELTKVGKEGGDLRVGLSPRLEMDLSIDLAAAKADVDLTGLRVTHLRVNGGASEIDIDFDAPNPAMMRSLDVDVGAAVVRIEGIADARPADVTVDVAGGSAELDFSGTWTRDIEARVDAVIGRVVFRVPSDIGIRVELDRTMASFENADLVRRGNAYVSANYDAARYRLNISADVLMAGFEIERR